METLQSLRQKLDTAEDLHSVVKTMKAHAAVNIRQYQEAVESLEQYHVTIETAFRMLMRDHPIEERIKADEVSQTRLGIVALGSDQGMCGQLNEQVANHLESSLDEWGIEPGRRRILAVGVRMASRLEGLAPGVEHVFHVPASARGIGRSVQDLLIHLGRWRFEEGIDRIVLFYSEYLSGASYEAVSEQLLPIDPDWLRELRQKPWPTRQIPMLYRDWADLLESVISQYLFTWLFRAFAQSLASENASRLASMQGAEKNIEERLDDLTRDYQRQRQTSITSELLDIVSGFEALSSGGE